MCYRGVVCARACRPSMSNAVSSLMRGAEWPGHRRRPARCPARRRRHRRRHPPHAHHRRRRPSVNSPAGPGARWRRRRRRRRRPRPQARSVRPCGGQAAPGACAWTGRRRPPRPHHHPPRPRGRCSGSRGWRCGRSPGLRAPGGGPTGGRRHCLGGSPLRLPPRHCRRRRTARTDGRGRRRSRRRA